MSNLKLDPEGSKNNRTDSIIKRLDVIIYFLFKYHLKEHSKEMKHIFSEIKDLGLDDSEIADIFGKSKSYISSAITKSKKEEKKS